MYHEIIHIIYGQNNLKLISYRTFILILMFSLNNSLYWRNYENYAISKIILKLS